MPMQTKIVMGSIIDTEKKHVFVKVFGYMSGDTVWIVAVKAARHHHYLFHYTKRAKKSIPKSAVNIIACLRNKNDYDFHYDAYVNIGEDDKKQLSLFPDLTMEEVCKKFGKSNITSRKNYIFQRYIWSDESCPW